MTGPSDSSIRFTDDLVVGLPQADLVAGKLLDLRVWAGPTEVRISRDERLGLALLTGLTGLPAAADAIRAAGVDRIAALETAGNRAFTPIELLLHELRRQFRDELAGYVPPLGKNRIATPTVGWSYEKPMALPHPLAVGPAEHPGSYRKPMSHPHPAVTPHSVWPDPYRDPHVGIVDGHIALHASYPGRFLAAPGALLASPPHHPLPFMAGHATFVADLITQLAPTAVVEAAAVLDPTTGTATAWDAAAAIVAFADSGVGVLNLSIGCRTEDGQPPLLLRAALDRLPPELVVVAAAGNHGQPDADGCPATVAPVWPAAFDQVVAVGSTGPDGYSAFSGYGPWVDCTAPGEDLVAAYPVKAEGEVYTGYASWSGTSFAAATVSGAITARIVPGRVPAQEALALLLDDPRSPVRRLVYQRPGPRSDRDA